MSRWSTTPFVLFAVAALFVEATSIHTIAAGAGPSGPEVLGHWTPPFEEGGSGTARCRDEDGRIECKPVGQALSVLPDGRILYFNGVEGAENIERSFFSEAAPAARTSQSRLLDLRSGVAQWALPTPADGGGSNPNIKPGHRSTDDPLGMAGVPGRPGDGLVGSTWGSLGGPPHDPTSSPDDPQANDTDLFCSDVTHLPDGRLLVAGGTDYYNEPDVMQKDRDDPADVGLVELEGLRMARVFDPRTASFSATAPMKYGRWYPTVVSLPDGNILVASGVSRLAKNTQGSQVRRTETYDPQTNYWTENDTGPASENSLPLYPRLWLAPSGKVFFGATGQNWNPVGHAVDEATWTLEQFFNPATKRWEVTGVAPFGFRGYSGDVMLPLTPPYDTATILSFGGTLLPTPGTNAATTLATLTTLHRNGGVTTTITGHLNAARWFPSGVLLPDGQVFAANGSDRDALLVPGTEIAVRTPELYNPSTGRWSSVAEAARDRTYHSSALLLPDARVLVGGHAPGPTGWTYPHDAGKPLANNDKDPSFEVWSPPYLYRGRRPVIRSVPAGVAWRQTFTIGTPDAGEIESVQLMRLPSVQHTIDPDQRAIMLAFTRQGNGLRVTAPPSGTVAPPGHYYLFINRRTDYGAVPSVARIVHVGVSADSAEALQPTSDDPPEPAGSASEDADTSMSPSVRRWLGRPGSWSPATTGRRSPGTPPIPSDHRINPVVLKLDHRERASEMARSSHGR